MTLYNWTVDQNSSIGAGELFLSTQRRVFNLIRLSAFHISRNIALHLAVMYNHDTVCHD